MPEEDKEHNRTLKRTVKKIRKSLDDKRFYPRANVMLDRVILALVSKSVNVAQGVVSLIDAGLPEEAFGLSRTLVEVALSLRFVTNRDSERRAKRFAHYSAKWKLELIRRALKHFKAQDSKGQLQPKYTKTQLRKMTPDYKRMVKLARKYPKRFAAGWSGKNAREMALEADGHDKIDGKPVVWEFDYDWIYMDFTVRSCDGSVHGQPCHGTPRGIYRADRARANFGGRYVGGGQHGSLSLEDSTNGVPSARRIVSGRIARPA